MTILIDILAAIGAVTVAYIAYREACFWWKSRKWVRTPWLMTPGL